MAIHAHTIHSVPGATRTTKRVGRGNASRKGTSSGRGGKGQTARSGGQRRSASRALRRSILRIPKLRGFRSMYAKPEVVTLTTLERVAEEGETVSPLSLQQKGVTEKPDRGVKIVATGTLKKKLTVSGCFASKAAAAAIEKTGGKIIF